MSLDAALTSARQAATVLKALPHDPVAGYTDDEIAAQYAATDRLLAALQQIDAEIRCVRFLNTPTVGKWKMTECSCHREHSKCNHERCCGHEEGRDPDCPFHGDGSGPQ